MATDQRHRLRQVAAAVVLIAVATGFETQAEAQNAPCTRSWASPVDGDFADPNRWEPNGVPAFRDRLCITVSGEYTVTYTGTARAASIQLGSSPTSRTPTLAFSKTDELLTTIVNNGTIIVNAPIELIGEFTNNGNLVLNQPLGQSYDFINAGNIRATGDGRLVMRRDTFIQGQGTTTGNPVEIADLQFTGTGSSSFVTNRNSTLTGDIAPGQTVTVEAIGNTSGASLFIPRRAGTVNGGVINLTQREPAGSAPSFLSGGVLTNRGTINVLDIPNRASFGPRRIGATLVNDAGGTVNVGSDLTVNGLGFTNSGTVAVAGRIITSTFYAGFTQTPSGTFQTTVDKDQVGQLVADRPIVLDGTLAVNTTSAPAVGTEFDVVRFLVRTGEFAVNSFTGGTTYDVRYDPNSVRLVNSRGDPSAATTPTSTGAVPESAPAQPVSAQPIYAG